MGIRWQTDGGPIEQQECARRNRLEAEKAMHNTMPKEEFAEEFVLDPFIAFMLGHDFTDELRASNGSVASLNAMLAKAQSYGATRPWPEWVKLSQAPVIEPVQFKKSLIWALNCYWGFNLSYDLAEEPEEPGGPKGRQLEL